MMTLVHNIANYFKSPEGKVARISIIESELNSIREVKDMLVDQYEAISKALKSDEFTCKEEAHFSDAKYVRQIANLKLTEKGLLKELDILKSNDKVIGYLKELHASEAKNFIKSLYKAGKLDLDQYNHAAGVKDDSGRVKYADVIVTTSDQKFFLLKRNRWEDEHKGAWVVPGGHVDKGEDFETAAKRELLEESGISVDKILSNRSLLSSWRHVGTSKEPKAHIEYYNLHIHSEDDVEILLDEGEAVGYLWVPVSEIDNYDMIFNMKPNIVKVMHWGSQPNLTVIRKAVKLGIIPVEKVNEISKALSHKYLRKTPDGKGGFNYIYEEPKARTPVTEECFVIKTGLSKDWQTAITKWLDIVPENAVPTTISNFSQMENAADAKAIFKNVPRAKKHYYGVAVSVIGSVRIPKDMIPESLLNKVKAAGWFNERIYEIAKDYPIIYQFFNKSVQCVGVNSKYFPTNEAIAEIKKSGEDRYKEQTGNSFRVNFTLEGTLVHELGHVYSNRTGVANRKEWAELSDKWYKEVKADLIKDPSEAFAEAFSNYYVSQGADLPDYIKDFFQEHVDNDRNIVKALGHKYLRKEPDGKGGFIYVYEELKGRQTKENYEVGDEIKDEEKGLNVKRYSDKSVLITGKTYQNLNLLRKIKEEIGVGTWNKGLNGWVYPIQHIDTILAHIISETEDGPKKDTLINTKNAALAEGDSVDVLGASATVTANVSDETGVKYDVEMADGTTLTGVDERAMTTPPATDEQAAEINNEVTPATRSKAVKQEAGLTPDFSTVYTKTLDEVYGMMGCKKGDYPEIDVRLAATYEESIRQAVADGKEISDEVLDQFPELKIEYHKQRQAMSEETKRKISEALKKHNPEDAAKAYMESLTPEQVEELKSAFAAGMSEYITAEQGKLATMVLDYAQMEKDKLKAYADARATDDYAKKIEFEKIARSMNPKMIDLTPLITHQKNIVNTLTAGGTIVEITDATGTKNVSIPDFTSVDTTKITFDIDTILTEPRPSYIPEIDEETFRRRGYVLDAVRIGPDQYVVAANEYKELRTPGMGNGYEHEHGYDSGIDPDNPGTKVHDGISNGYVVVTLDQLVLTNDYYITKKKGQLKKDADDRTKRGEAYWDSLSEERRLGNLNQRGVYDSLPAAVRKKVTKDQWYEMSLADKEKHFKNFKKYGPEKLKMRLDEHTMYNSYHNMYERFIDPEAKAQDKDGRLLERGTTYYGTKYADPQVWSTWSSFAEMMQWKMKDIRIQREFESDMRKAALETSYGPSNTNDALKSELGIMVKRQNGDVINAQEIDEIKEAWGALQNSFGPLKTAAERDNIRISHSGKKHMFASQAAGLYIPSMGAIGVSAKFGSDQFGFTMGHEVAHWIDHSLGKLGGKRYASDNYESTAGKIAIAFRKSLNATIASEYTNSTTECFARALEQYHAIETVGEGAEMARMGKYFASRDYVNKNDYETKVKPLIKQFLEENKDILKSIGVDIEKAFDKVSDLYIMDQISDELYDAAKSRYEAVKTEKDKTNGQQV